MNAPRPRTTLNIIFEDLNLLRKTSVFQTLIRMVTGRQDIANLKRNPLNLPEHFFTDLNERIEQASEMSPGGKVERDFSKAKFLRLCFHHASSILDMLKIPGEESDIGVRFQALGSLFSDNYNRPVLEDGEREIHLWILDSDGLNLTSDMLNRAGHITVRPVTPFFTLNREDILNDQTHKFHRPTVYLRNGGNQAGAYYEPGVSDHFILFLNPNLESIEYDTSEETKKMILEMFDRDTVTSVVGRNNALVDQPALSELVGISYLSSSRRPPYVAYIDSDEVKDLVREHLFSEPWDPTHITDIFYRDLSLDEFSQLADYSRTRREGSPNRMEEDFIAGAIYFRKHRALPKERLFYGQYRITPLSFEEIVQSTLLTKWSAQTPAGEAAVQCHWTRPNVCNAPIQINGQVEFCQNVVEGSLRCSDCGN